MANELFDYAVAGAGILISWLFKILFGKIEKLEVSSRSMLDKISYLKTHVKSSYVTREEHNNNLIRIHDKLDKIYEEVSKKADRE